MVRSFILATAAAALSLGHASAKDNGPAGTRYMTTEELWQMYNNRSWIWKDGAGYFPNAKRRFTAYSGSGKAGSYAEGVWFVTWMGKACFRATWHGADYAVPKLTCFSHRTDGKRIHQKRLPDGEWYVFRNSPPRNGDEFGKFLLGDYVSKGSARNRRAAGN